MLYPFRVHAKYTMAAVVLVRRSSQSKILCQRYYDGCEVPLSALFFGSLQSFCHSLCHCDCHCCFCFSCHLMIFAFALRSSDCKPFFQLNWQPAIWLSAACPKSSCRHKGCRWLAPWRMSCLGQFQT